MKLALLALAVCAAPAAFAQKYTGPVPEKPDLIYIVQADNLLPTEAATAQQEKGKKGETIYYVPRTSSPARTPLASPVFLVKVKELAPESLELYRLEVRNNRREIIFPGGKKPKNPEPIRVDLKRVGEDLVRLEVGASLPNGEYSFTPKGSNDVFCFEVF